MEFFSETKFNAPIKGQNNESGNPELNILGGVTVTAAHAPSGGASPQIIINPAEGNVTIDSKVSILHAGGGEESSILGITPADHRIDVGADIWSTKSINTSDNITTEGNISACGTITACGNITATEGTITAKNITSQCSINASGDITGGMINVNGDIIAGSSIRGRTIDAQNSIMLSGETITSWAELKGTAGPSIQRFTSPALPADCSQFYFEGCNPVTGTELPFIQVRETATGKLVQMDVWVNLDGCCSGFTVGKPVAEVEPCSSVIEAGKWTAIVMN